MLCDTPRKQNEGAGGKLIGSDTCSFITIILVCAFPTKDRGAACLLHLQPLSQVLHHSLSFLQEVLRILYGRRGQGHMQLLPKNLRSFTCHETHDGIKLYFFQDVKVNLSRYIYLIDI